MDSDRDFVAKAFGHRVRFDTAACQVIFHHNQRRMRSGLGCCRRTLAAAKMLREVLHLHTSASGRGCEKTRISRMSRDRSRAEPAPGFLLRNDHWQTHVRRSNPHLPASLGGVSTQPRPIPGIPALVTLRWSNPSNRTLVRRAETGRAVLQTRWTKRLLKQDVATPPNAASGQLPSKSENLASTISRKRVATREGSRSAGSKRS